MTHEELAEIIGPLAHRLTQKQLDELEPIATSNPTGLAKVVANIENDPNIDSEVGTLLSRVRRSDIPRARRATSGPHDPRDWARRLYATKITDLHKHDAGWTETEQRQYAIDYALDHCRANGTELLRTIERELQTEHGITLTGRERDFERDTEHRRLMLETHRAPTEPAYADEPEP